MLRRAGEVTAEAEVQLLYESFLNVEKTLALYELSGKTFRLCYDTFNPLRYGFGDPRDELKRYPLALIDQIHFKDAPTDFSPSALLGTGRGYFKEAAQIIREIGYTGWLFTYNYYCTGRLGRDRDPLESAAMDRVTICQQFPSD